MRLANSTVRTDSFNFCPEEAAGMEQWTAGMRAIIAGFCSDPDPILDFPFPPSLPRNTTTTQFLVRVPQECNLGRSYLNHRIAFRGCRNCLSVLHPHAAWRKGTSNQPLCRVRKPMTRRTVAAGPKMACLLLASTTGSHRLAAMVSLQLGRKSNGDGYLYAGTLGPVE
jgi:hypothetical protein